MLDALAIFCSTVCVIFVLIRTAYIDRTTPWFEEDGGADATIAKEANRSSAPRNDRTVHRY